MEIQYRFADTKDLPDLIELLVNNSLPVTDIKAANIDFIVATDEQDKIIGSIGCERFDTEALLRSFAVNEQLRDKRIGAELLKRLIDFSRQNGISTLHLLTTTAAKYFEQKGFINSLRETAPGSIISTEEFSNICPASSAYMTMKI